MNAPELQLTPEAPWPGPAAYTDQDVDFFKGRAAETAELHRLIHAEPVCVLYALSGLGKTSLLQAGVFPRLCVEGWMPVRIRLDHRDQDDDGLPVPGLTEQVLTLVARAARACGVSVPVWDGKRDTLSQSVHERGGRFWGASEDDAVTLVLVFDQFEECWTQTRDRPAARARAEALLGEVAALIDWRGTASLAPAPVRVVFSLREDQLAPLDALRPLFPGLRRARLRLLPFTAAQAFEVVEQPGMNLLDQGAAQAIVETFADPDADRPMADPALLAIFCWRVNEDRRSRHANTITAARVFQMRGEFVRHFYNSAFALLSPDQALGARRFVESDLIDAAGFRTSAGFEHARQKYGVTSTTLDHLVEARLLHAVDRSGGHRHVELVHDRIAEEAATQRAEREEAETKKRAEEEKAVSEKLATVEKQKLQADLARARQRALILGALAFFALAALAYAIVMGRKAREAQTAAVEAENQAIASKNDALKAKNEAVASESDALKAKDQAVKAQKETETANERIKVTLADLQIQKTEADALRKNAQDAANAITEEKIKADKALEKALAARKSADEIIKFIQYDIRESLKDPNRLEALQRINDLVSSYRNEHSSPNDDASSQHDYAVLLDQQGDLLFAKGEFQKAKATYEKSLTIAERLTKLNPDDVDLQRALSIRYDRIGDTLNAEGDCRTALEWYRKGLLVIEKLTKLHPDDARWWFDLSESYIKIGDTQYLIGDDESARQSYSYSIDSLPNISVSTRTNATKNISEADSERSAADENSKSYRETYKEHLSLEVEYRDSQEILSEDYKKKGRIAAASGENMHALNLFRKALEIAEPLAKRFLSKVQLQDHLLSCYDDISNVLLIVGDDKAAKEYVQKALAVVEYQLLRRPGNIKWQLSLAAYTSMISSMLEKAGDQVGALKQAESALAIYKKQSKRDLKNTSLQSKFLKVQTQVNLLREKVMK